MKKIKIDLHNHLGRNGKFSSFDNVLDIAYENLGDGGIFGIVKTGVGESWERYQRFVDSSGLYGKEFIGDKGNVVFVPEKNIYAVSAQEVSTEQGHLLVVGLDEKQRIEDNKSLEYSLKDASDKEGKSVLVHPYSKNGVGKYLEEHLGLLDFLCGYEVYNGSAELCIPKVLPWKANKKAVISYFSKGMNLKNVGMCCFTDGHDERVVGRCSTKISEINASDSESFFNSLEKNIREKKGPVDLVKCSNKWDAFKHAFNMVFRK